MRSCPAVEVVNKADLKLPEFVALAALMIGAAFDNTVLPLVAGFSILGTAALIVTKRTAA